METILGPKVEFDFSLGILRGRFFTWYTYRKIVRVGLNVIICVFTWIIMSSVCLLFQDSEETQIAIKKIRNKNSKVEIFSK